MSDVQLEVEVELEDEDEDGGVSVGNWQCSRNAGSVVVTGVEARISNDDMGDASIARGIRHRR